MSFLDKVCSFFDSNYHSSITPKVFNLERAGNYNGINIKCLVEAISYGLNLPIGVDSNGINKASGFNKDYMFKKNNLDNISTFTIAHILCTSRYIHKMFGLEKCIGYIKLNNIKTCSPNVNFNSIPTPYIYDWTIKVDTKRQIPVIADRIRLNKHLTAIGISRGDNLYMRYLNDSSWKPRKLEDDETLHIFIRQTHVRVFSESEKIIIKFRAPFNILNKYEHFLPINYNNVISIDSNPVTYIIKSPILSHTLLDILGREGYIIMESELKSITTVSLGNFVSDSKGVLSDNKVNFSSDINDSKHFYVADGVIIGDEKILEKIIDIYKNEASQLSNISPVYTAPTHYGDALDVWINSEEEVSLASLPDICWTKDSKKGYIEYPRGSGISYYGNNVFIKRRRACGIYPLIPTKAGKTIFDVTKQYLEGDNNPHKYIMSTMLAREFAKPLVFDVVRCKEHNQVFVPQCGECFSEKYVIIGRNCEIEYCTKDVAMYFLDKKKESIEIIYEYMGKCFKGTGFKRSTTSDIKPYKFKILGSGGLNIEYYPECCSNTFCDECKEQNLRSFYISHDYGCQDLKITKGWCILDAEKPVGIEGSYKSRFLMTHEHLTWTPQPHVRNEIILS